MAPMDASAVDFVEFVNASPSPYHAVASAVSQLEAAGFRALRERDEWSSAVRPGGRYYVTRNGSTVAAFAVGGRWRPGGAVAMVGAHTDSPCLRLKPVSKRSAAGYLQVGVETYGGGIWHSWFDRDLSIAGRVMVRRAEGGGVAQRLVRVDRPLLRIPTLAIHLDRQSGFDPNRETELFPIAGLAAAELNKSAAEAGAEADEGGPLGDMAARHHPALLDVVAAELGVEVGAIDDFELVLYDTQKSCVGGLADELIFSARLDNLGMTYCAVAGLVASLADGGACGGGASLADDDTVRLIACFDHEEVGSVSAQGAASDLLPALLRRLAALPGGDDTAYERSMARSFLVSADMAHAVHPNYAAKYEAAHQPALNRGPVIKVNANQRYATNAPGVVLVKECARRAAVRLQLFVVRNDSPCGSTIGPGLAARLGARTLDLGNPQLSMHSVRETAGARDVDHAVRLFAAFFRYYGSLEPTILVD